MNTVYVLLWSHEDEDDWKIHSIYNTHEKAVDEAVHLSARGYDVNIQQWSAL